MKASAKAISFLTKEEGVVLKAYRDSAGIPTIGIGTIVYPDGRKVKMGDQITMAQALAYLHHEVDSKTKEVENLLTGIALNQNQFDALVSIVYNIGVGGFKSSTLLRRVKANPCDPAIREAFMMWNKITDPKTKKKVEARGLTLRRKREADLYFSPTL